MTIYRKILGKLTVEEASLSLKLVKAADLREQRDPNTHRSGKLNRNLELNVQVVLLQMENRNISVSLKATCGLFRIHMPICFLSGQDRHLERNFSLFDRVLVEKCRQKL